MNLPGPLAMNLGPNEELVQEVIDFFEGRQLELGILMGEVPIDPAPFEVTKDFPKAVFLATSQEVWMDGYSVWNDIREWLVSPVKYGDDGAYSGKREVLSWFERRRRQFDSSFREQFTREAISVLGKQHRYFVGRMANIVSVDYVDIAFARYQLGASHPFYEMLFSAYRQGGWPCGWKGDQPEDQDPYVQMPDGKMVVYHIGPKV